MTLRVPEKKERTCTVYHVPDTLKPLKRGTQIRPDYRSFRPD